ncbi:MAG: PC4/YdbC family ssDNA-binding protein [Bacillota bacterium]|nr:PC4/YdbC family ssDNA-binding protein [Bacillota bacterium]
MNRGRFIPNIIKHYGVLYETDRGWTCEVNLVAWNGGEPKLDIRTWGPDKAKDIGKGVRLAKEATIKLHDILGSIVESEE